MEEEFKEIKVLDFVKKGNQWRHLDKKDSKKV